MKVDVKQLVNDLSKPDGPENYRARMRLRNETARVAGKGQEGQKAEFAAALAKAFVEARPKARRELPRLPHTGSAMRGELLRSLCEIATAAEVPVLMRAIEEFRFQVAGRPEIVTDDVEILDAIRRVIECIQGDEATSALAQMAVKGGGTEFRIGAINALGKRKNAAALDALRTCAADPDPRIRLAAAEALAEYGDPSVQPVIAQAFDPQRGWAPHANAARTHLQLAASVAKAGNKAAADQLYRAVGTAQPQPFQVRAAEIGVQQPAQQQRR